MTELVSVELEALVGNATDKESSATAGLMQTTDANVNSEEMSVHRLRSCVQPNSPEVTEVEWLGCGYTTK
jgi:hypothetical protein